MGPKKHALDGSANCTTWRIRRIDPRCGSGDAGCRYHKYSNLFQSADRGAHVAAFAGIDRSRGAMSGVQVYHSHAVACLLPDPARPGHVPHGGTDADHIEQRHGDGDRRRLQPTYVQRRTGRQRRRSLVVFSHHHRHHH